MIIQWSLTKHFTMTEPQERAINDSFVARKLRSPDFVTLNLWYVRSGDLCWQLAVIFHSLGRENNIAAQPVVVSAHHPPDEPFYIFRALRSGDRRILRSSGTSHDGCWSSKVVKGSVGFIDHVRGTNQRNMGDLTKMLSSVFSSVSCTMFFGSQSVSTNNTAWIA